MLKYRLVTALIAIPLLFLAIWYFPPLYFALFMAAFIGFAAWEWSSLMGINRSYLQAIYVVVVLLGLYFVRPLPILPLLIIGFFIWLWAGVGVYLFHRDKKPAGFQFPVIQAITGFFILVTCWLALINLRLGAGEYGAIRLLLGLAIVFAADTGAYMAGRLWGKHPLIPKVSPKKTWEGLFGGLALAMVVGIIPTFYFPMSMYQRLGFWGLSLLVALFSVVGDLTVSMLKRQSGVKDSGQLLPGHGGILDRLDSVAAGILVFALGLILFGV